MPALFQARVRVCVESKAQTLSQQNCIILRVCTFQFLTPAAITAQEKNLCLTYAFSRRHLTTAEAPGSPEYTKGENAETFLLPDAAATFPPG